MKELLAVTKTNRKILSNFINSHSTEELNKVPDGFRNNIIWNIAHVIVVQQVLTYALSNQPVLIAKDMIETFKKGTKTEGLVSKEEISRINDLLFSTVEQTETDWNAGVFKTYNAYLTSTGYEIKSTADAMQFNNFHEGIHLGYILALRKSL